MLHYAVLNQIVTYGFWWDIFIRLPGTALIYLGYAVCLGGYLVKSWRAVMGGMVLMGAGFLLFDRLHSL